MPVLVKLIEGVAGSKVLLNLSRHPDNASPENNSAPASSLYMVTLFRAHER